MGGATMTEVVAELSSNHNGSLPRMLKLIKSCAYAGAHAVKFQTWKVGTMVYDRGFKLEDGPWKGRNLYELYEEAHTPWEWYPEMIELAKRMRVPWFSSVFDLPSLEMLESLDCPRYKISSFELVDLTLIAEVASTGKPMVFSTGMATIDEIDQAVMLATTSGCKDITLLKCTSAYPANAENANLATLFHMEHEFMTKFGLSDHTQGIGVAIIAADRGACMIEKHVKLNDGNGLDAEFSITTSELANLVLDIQRAKACIGKVQYGPLEEEMPQLALRRSLYYAQDLKKGTVISKGHITSARPALGLHPHTPVIGKTLAVDVSAYSPTKQEHFVVS